MTTVSPPSQFIYIPNVEKDRNLLLKTQPFYSIFFKTNRTPNTNLSNQIRRGANAFRRYDITPSGEICQNVFKHSQDPQFFMTDDIPFHLFGSTTGKENLYFLLVVFVSVVVVGVISFSYWSFLLGNNLMEDKFKKIVETRSIYLSVFFIFLMIVLSLMSYEFFSLKKLSLRWFANYQDNQPTSFYDFILNTRKIFLWSFMILWLAVVLFITIVISRRPEQFKRIIAINVVSIFLLFCFQYIYYKTSSKLIKTFCLILSVFIIGLVMFFLFRF